jgi:predicted ribosome quality control (RQC) complex YloA/Tae2 family protein
MTSEMNRESRADSYERFGHILMALQTSVPSGVESVTLDDVVSGSGTISIPLKKRLSAVQNAELYYERAREARKRRRHAGQRLAELDSRLAGLQTLLEELRMTSTLSDVEKFRQRRREALASLSSQKSGVQSDVPFRRFDLGGGYEVWVGRTAAQNDLLTLKYARKHDLWMHARGVPGSHVVLRRPRRDENPPAAIVEKAASIAAFYSKGSTSELVPVAVAERRYVRKPSKSPPGTVIVERELVLMVSPELPSG